MADFFHLVVSGRIDEIAGRLAADPALASRPAATGAGRQQAKEFFFRAISHYLYAGDTPLHMAAAAFRRPVAELLVKHGANVSARNRRGAQPLHYAADTHHWNPSAQAETITYLIAIGADPNAQDNDGVGPLHRAVRTRSLPAVQALIDGGADPTRPSGRGSTPLHLAVQTTGKSGSGSPHAREQQVEIINFLLRRGARPTDADANGKRVSEAATSARIRALLHEA
jgi:ankyrin repeat protein